MKELIQYIEKLENESFECWSEQAKMGYLTACCSIKERAKKIMVMDNIKVKSITVVNTGSGADNILFDVDLPIQVFPCNGTATLKMESAKHLTEDFIKKYFPNTPYKIVRE